ncbi:hypothetical protein Dimus_003921, partial [Dionaea muscipula]
PLAYLWDESGNGQQTKGRCRAVVGVRWEDVVGDGGMWMRLEEHKQLRGTDRTRRGIGADGDGGGAGLALRRQRRWCWVRLRLSPSCVGGWSLD